MFAVPAVLRRAFGMAVGLCGAGAFAWPRFQAALIARIAAWRAAAAPEEPCDCDRLWLAALEDVLVERSAVSAGEVAERAGALARRRPGPGRRGRPGRGHAH
ncbi:nitrile hydratase accessory protein [Streptacidiphilus sp. ASG 303]|uniref:nitrile hydratase accessory protein n=1 Tax=Streptacidiphilus sp. ASG 303 TaxID=2896847 RepID=UPI001E357167|nr:nitrile hydratase accessory protein [Streptacidiphilus sp. ASG 303]MCD0486478.1 nitrile hydratase accessory protein [Streptacidiphilus sp. ASG 303]